MGAKKQECGKRASLWERFGGVVAVSGICPPQRLSCALSMGELTYYE